jgi:RNA polymerase sigma-70 factor (ECF subfamily)
MQDNVNIENLWKNVYGKIFGYVSKHVKDLDETNDIIQNTFIKVREHIDELKHPGKAEQWMFRIAQNSMYDYFREKKKESELQKNLQISIQNDGNEANESIIKTQNLSDYAGFISNSLPEKYRIAVYMADIEGKSMKEVATALDLSVSGAKSRVQRGRKMIKELILQCCQVQTDVYGNIIDYKPHQNFLKK